MRNFVKLVISKALYLLYILLNLIIPKKGNQIAFISFPGASDNSWYLYKHMAKKYHGLHLIWLLDELSSKESAQNKILSIQSANRVSIIKKWSVKGIFYFCSSKFVFHTHGTYSFVGKALNAPTLVNLWHGMPIKAIGYLDKNNKYVCYSDYVLSTSDFYKKIMSKAFGISIPNSLNMGLPRNDVLKNGLSKSEKDKILRKLSINSDSNLILWLPTYRQSKIGDIRKDSISSSFIDELSSDFLENLNKECKKNNCITVVKLHPMDCLNIDMMSSYENIKFMDSQIFESLNVHLYDLLSISKVLISDVSSVLIDCIPTDISIGIIENSHAAYTRDLVIDLKDLKKHTFSIKQPEDIFQYLQKETISFSIFNDGIYDSCTRISQHFLGGSNKTKNI